MTKLKSFILLKGGIFNDADKILLYKETLKRLSKCCYFGICSNIVHSMFYIFDNVSKWGLYDHELKSVDYGYKHIELYHHGLNPVLYEYKYVELYKYKPKNGYDGYWFPLDENGQSKRIEIINMIIKDLETNIKTQTHGKH